MIENFHNYSKNKIKQLNIINYNDYELNTLIYKQALIYDKRTFFYYYFSLIRTKHPLIFSFCPLNDYNSKIIKINIFLLFIIIHYANNALFFNGATIHKIYIDKGIYNFKYLAPKIIYSFIISYVVYILIKYLSLSERSILKIKNELTSKKVNDIVDKIKKKFNY